MLEATPKLILRYKDLNHRIAVVVISLMRQIDEKYYKFLVFFQRSSAEGKLRYFEGSDQFVTQYNKVTVTVSPLSSVYRKWTGAKMRCEALELAIT